MAKNLERTAQTKQKLVDAFWKLYCQKRIEKITIKAITDEAGFYRSTFYEYFSDVYEVLEEIENHLIGEYRETIRRVYQSDDLASAQKVGMSYCVKHADYLAVLLGPNGDPKFYNAVKDLLKEALYEILAADKSDIQGQLILELFSSFLITMLNSWYQNRDSLDLQDVLAVGAGIMQNGIVSYMKDLGVPFLNNTAGEK